MVFEVIMSIQQPGPLRDLRRLSYSAAVRGNSLEQLFEEMQAAIDADGAVIIEGALTDAETDQIVEEMTPFIDATPIAHGGFPTDHDTRRIGALVARSPASHKAVAHPVMLEVCKRVLGEQRLSGRRVQRMREFGDTGKPTPYPWRLSLTQIIDVGPGSQKQSIHRGNGLWQHDFQRTFDPQIETMWALSDFTEENGATHVLPGSHRWDPPGNATEDEAIQTMPAARGTMPKGSVLVWTGWTYHGAGVNHGTGRRVGLNIDYILSFLQTEENQFLACPPQIARSMDVEMQRLLGYKARPGAGHIYGKFAEVLRADVALREGYDVTVPGSHELPMPTTQPPPRAKL